MRKTTRHGEDNRLQQSFRYVGVGNVETKGEQLMNIVQYEVALFCLSPSQQIYGLHHGT